MGGWFSGGNSSTKSYATDSSVSATGNAVVVSTQLAKGAIGGDKINLVINKGGTYSPEINNGLGETEVGSIITAALAGLQGVGSTPTNQSLDKAVEDALKKRVTKQIEEGPAKEKELPKAVWLILAGGSVLLLVFGGIKLFRRKQ